MTTLGLSGACTWIDRVFVVWTPYGGLCKATIASCAKVSGSNFGGMPSGQAASEFRRLIQGTRTCVRVLFLRPLARHLMPVIFLTLFIAAGLYPAILFRLILHLFLPKIPPFSRNMQINLHMSKFFRTFAAFCVTQNEKNN